MMKMVQSLITQEDLLANATDVDGDNLEAVNLRPTIQMRLL
ncbi:cadherin-like domain-containing protein [Vibrio lentus]|nr:cadherin-like domain-containing protein [Vibrio lentus]